MHYSIRAKFERKYGADDGFCHLYLNIIFEKIMHDLNAMDKRYKCFFFRKKLKHRK
jgi:hypothetical protein